MNEDGQYRQGQEEEIGDLLWSNSVVDAKATRTPIGDDSNDKHLSDVKLLGIANDFRDHPYVTFSLLSSSYSGSRDERARISTLQSIRRRDRRTRHACLTGNWRIALRATSRGLRR